jgi:hypothetical protein
MDKPKQPKDLSYQARAGITDNLFLQRRRAGYSQAALSITLNDLLAGVAWTPGIVEFEFEPGYKVEFDIEAPDKP